MSEFNISTPIGWDGTKFVSPTKDPNLHHIECWDNPDQDWISICLFWNKKFSEIPEDEKFPYKGAHYYMKLSVEEAYLLKDALDQHIRNYNGKNT